MEFSSKEPDRMFDHFVPPRLQKATLRCLIWAYAQAERRCRKFTKEIAHDHRPLERRTLFEHRWLQAAQRQGVSAASELNEAGNCFHTTIRVGPIVWLASAVEAPDHIVRLALFRKSLAESNQRLLFPDQQIKHQEGSPLCALLIHGPTSSKVPYFANVVFPLPDCQHYAESKIYLFTKFPAVAAATQGAREEVIGDTAEPQLRKDIPKTGDEA